ncbi:hypothetical protein EJ05DRAFT_504928 [Pseudovirgaria hyperparasitica]|uniref:Uncharacterized protein n=1 Tax=Pseudovirgaria hyperparasitica TaxID=470096 RepID=A0A6A6VSZ7_9PEZI|nr:uncharacterized protein EJ05DRAFT_504928 [Pseudovirgaria hyperparasitica]KAF2753275.1 hypothetical protein EJ05DRAFT_504928 [Pseudovirgaria hyperparasitica]
MGLAWGLRSQPIQSDNAVDVHHYHQHLIDRGQSEPAKQSHLDKIHDGRLGHAETHDAKAYHPAGKIINLQRTFTNAVHVFSVRDIISRLHPLPHQSLLNIGTLPLQALTDSRAQQLEGGSDGTCTPSLSIKGRSLGSSPIALPLKDQDLSDGANGLLEAARLHPWMESNGMTKDATCRLPTHVIMLSSYILLVRTSTFLFFLLAYYATGPVLIGTVDNS